MTLAQRFRALQARPIAMCVLTGFASGLPLFFLLNLVPAWLRDQGVNLRDIGLIALVGLPYTWKFLWSPLCDRYALPFLGPRRGWLLLTQLILLAGMLSFSLLSPQESLTPIVVVAFLLALFSATQDIVIDAFRREILSDDQLAAGNGVHIAAYRIAGLIPGSMALILADHLPWSTVFLIISPFMLIGVVLTLWADEPVHKASMPLSMRSAIVEPFQEFFQRFGWRRAALILSFMILYKLGDALATTLATPFYLDMGYSKTEIGLIAKNASLWAFVAGGLAGGLIMTRIGIARGLWVFGVAQWLVIFGFAALSTVAPEQRNLWYLALVIAAEALAVGMGAAAFVTYIASIASRTHLVTQMALLTALTAIPRTVVSAVAGYWVEQLGWTNYFLLCAALALPGMLLLLKIAPWNTQLQSTN